MTAYDAGNLPYIFFNYFKYIDIGNDIYMYMYCQQFNNKIAASMLFCVVGNMTALYDSAYYYSKMMAEVRIFMMTILKWANC